MATIIVTNRRQRRQPAEEPGKQQRTADELGRQRQDGVEARSRNAQLGEELGHLVEVVQLAPTSADGRPRQA